MSQHHQLIKNDPRWKRARADCLDRDGSACVECGETERLEVDHIIRLEDAPELAFDLENLQTLCTDCHDEKERQYAARQLERVEWISPHYSELIKLIEREKENANDNANETVTLFL